MSAFQNNHTTMRVYVTERCNANCKSCFNAMSRSNAEMSTNDFSMLCDYLKENGITFLKIMGGEPTVHNDFEKIIEIAQNHFTGLSLFTNGINRRIKNIHFRDTDSVVFNFLFSKLLSEETLYLENGGKRNLEIQIHSDTDEVELVKSIINIARIDKDRIHISLTLDCTSNIFLEKNVIVKKLQYIENFLSNNNYTFGYDHRMPLCYFALGDPLMVRLLGQIIIFHVIKLLLNGLCRVECFCPASLEGKGGQPVFQFRFQS